MPKFIVDIPEHSAYFDDTCFQQWTPELIKEALDRYTNSENSIRVKEKRKKQRGCDCGSKGEW